MKTKRVSIILPTYNEKGNIEELLRQVYHYAGKDLLEVIVVDDNSRDGTGDIVKRMVKEYKSLRLITRQNEKGLASAVWRGIKESKGSIIIWMDCDFSHPPKYIPELLRYIGQYDVVCASRYVNNGKDARSFTRILTSMLLNVFARLILGLKIRDLTSGFYAVRKEVFNKVRLMETGFAEYLIKFSYDLTKQGFSFKEIGYISPNRSRGSSKTEDSFVNFIADGCRCLKEIIKLRLGM